jgi:hypothetical protein
LGVGIGTKGLAAPRDCPDDHSTGYQHCLSSVNLWEDGIMGTDAMVHSTCYLRWLKIICSFTYFRQERQGHVWKFNFLGLDLLRTYNTLCTASKPM